MLIVQHICVLIFLLCVFTEVRKMNSQKLSKIYNVSFVDCQFEVKECNAVRANSVEDAEAIVLRENENAHFVFEVQHAA